MTTILDDYLVSTKPGERKQGHLASREVNGVMYQPLYYAEYKEYISQIQKLIDSSELFLKANEQIIEKFNTKKSSGLKARDPPSNTFIRGTILMSSVYNTLKEIELQPINNPSGVKANFLHHFVKEDESLRLERDSKMVPVTKNGNTRLVMQRFLPRVLKSEKNDELVAEFRKSASDYI